MEKTEAEPPWKTLRVSHFPTVSTAAGINLKVLCSKPQTRRMSHYEWGRDGGRSATWRTAGIQGKLELQKAPFDDGLVWSHESRFLDHKKKTVVDGLSQLFQSLNDPKQPLSI